MDEIKLELRKESWENIFYNIRQDPPENPKGNFWSAIQFLEEQFEMCINQKKSCIEDVVPKNQIKINFNQTI